MTLDRLREVLLSVGLFSVAIGSAGAQTLDLGPSYNHVFVFGDSLSDNGNVFAFTGGTIPTSPPYAPGRFSNGPMWVDDLFNGLEPFLVDPTAPDRNFAAGGARTDATIDLPNLVPPGVLAQIQLFQDNIAMTQTAIGPDDLFIAWAGANNIFDSFNYIAQNPGQFPDQNTAAAFLLATSDSAVADMSTAVQALIADGARTILVPNLPDLGKIPRFNTDPLRSAAATLASNRFNQGLFAALTTVSNAASGKVNIISMDIKTLYDLIRTHPAEFGFTNVTNACINQVSTVDPSTLTICSPTQAGQNQYVFWDEIHPTSAAHEIIALTAFGLLTADKAFETPMIISEMSLVTARALSRDISQRLIAVRGQMPSLGPALGPSTAGPSSATSRNGRFSIFLSGSYGFGDRSGSGLVQGFNYDLHTITGGAEMRLADSIVAGMAGSYAHAGTNFDTGGGFNLNAWQGALYATYFSGGFYLDASLAYGQSNIDNYIRQTVLAPIRAMGKTDGRHWSATGKAGYVYKTGNLAIGLDAGIRYIGIRVDGFAEQDAPILGFSVGDQKITSVAGLLGVQLSAEFGTDALHIVPHVSATYEAELDGKRQGFGRLIGNTANPFVIDDKLLKDDVVQLGAGVTMAWHRARLLVDYLTRVGIRGSGEDHQVAARLEMTF